VNPALAAAVTRASRRAYKSRHFQRAFMRGASAFAAGLPAESCPYRADPTKSWLQVYRQAWLSGWQFASARARYRVS
jgi:ribosome modulation factor